jgi:GntR family transcriptional regulator
VKFLPITFTCTKIVRPEGADMPPVLRQKPLYLQIADHYKELILTGQLQTGDLLPSVRQLMGEWGVNQNVAQRAVEHLHRAEKLVTTSTRGTFVSAPRAVLSPQMRHRLGTAPSEDVQVLAAELVDAPSYVVPILGLGGQLPTVIRREWVTTRPGEHEPYMLSVSWVAPQYRELVPELLHQVALPDHRGAAHLIAGRTGTEVLAGRTGFECRVAKADGRELVHLGLLPGDSVLAGVYTWRTAEDVLEYGEYVLGPSQVVELDMEP